MFVPARLHFQGLNRSRILRSGIPPPIQYMVGGKEWGEREADEAPKASETPGMLGFTYNGLLTPFRFIDPMWSISRFTVLGREAYFIFPNLVLFFWFFKWYLPNYFLWGDGKKPKRSIGTMKKKVISQIVQCKLKPQNKGAHGSKACLNLFYKVFFLHKTLNLFWSTAYTTFL